MLNHQHRLEAVAVDTVRAIDEARANGVVATRVKIEATTAADLEVITSSGCSCIVSGREPMVSDDLHGRRLTRVKVSAT